MIDKSVVDEFYSKLVNICGITRDENIFHVRWSVVDPRLGAGHHSPMRTVQLAIIATDDGEPQQPECEQCSYQMDVREETLVTSGGGEIKMLLCGDCRCPK